MHRNRTVNIYERGAMRARREQERLAVAKVIFRRLSPVLALAGFLVLLICSPSLALVTHRLEGSFNGSEAPEGPFSNVVGVATDNSGGPSSGDIYAAEVGGVDKLNPDGTYAGTRITGEETPQGALTLISFATFVTGAVAVDSSSGPNSGDVYVTDVPDGMVDKFTETGTFVCQISGAAEPSTAECAGATGSKTPDGSLGEPVGLAVDPSNGDLWVSDRAHTAVDEFNAAGEYLGQIKDSHVVTPGQLAIDATTGNLYITNGTNFVATSAPTDNVVVFHEGKFVRELDDHQPLDVAVDASDGHVFVFELEGRLIAEYDSAGNLIDTFTQTVNGSSKVLSIAVSADGHVYAGELGARAVVAKYGPDITVPTVVTEAATGVSETSAMMHGNVDPDTVHGGSAVTECSFEYVTQQAFEEGGFEGAAKASCLPAAPFSTPQAVSATATLAPSTTYKYRLSASNANEFASDGEVLQFSTVGPPLITAETAGTLTAGGVVLHAKINASGFEADCHVEYVDEATFQKSGFSSAAIQPCSPDVIPGGSTGETVSATVSGLALSTTYYYRFVSINSAGETQGTDETFATFGIRAFSFGVLNREGQPYTQAGGHPYEWTTSFALNTTETEITEHQRQAADANIRDVETELPPGLIASATATPRCPRSLVATEQCSSATQVGEIEVNDAEGNTFFEPLYNVTPPADVPLELGAVVANFVRVYIDGNVRTGGDYGATAKVLSTSEEDNIVSSRVTIWGVPADPSHDARRVCPIAGKQVPVGNEPCPSSAPRTPLLSNPTTCPGTPLSAHLRMDSWQSPGDFVSASSEIPATTGCGALDFSPSISVAPDTSVADSPSGLNVNLEVPQNESPGGLTTSALKNTTVRLPVGVAVSASAANGLEACSEAQIGLHTSEPASCPNGSKIGTVEVTSPLIADHLTGGVYVARQDENPFHSLLAMYIVAEADGARVKLAGHVVLDPVTGQLTTTFEETPQLPFSDFKLTLFGGPRGALATPESCGAFSSEVSLSPWDGLGVTTLGSGFSVSSGCVNGFNPALTAGSGNAQAGAYSPFTLSLARSDTDEEISGLTVKLPAGLLAKISGVTQCTDAQAAADACPAASQIGTVEASAGPGISPLSLPGLMYLTASYKGAPYGEEVVVPAVAGPFNLGDVVVRGTIQIDPVTAQATVTSDPLPTIVQGIPTRLRRIDVTVDRPNFVFNPTSCAPLALAASAKSVGGATIGLLSRFEVGGCGELPFKPSFKAAVGGPGSRQNGVSFDVNIVAPKQGPQSGNARSEANIRKVEVQLPKAIPSRLPTLQKACTAAQFAANPAGCPAASVVGQAVAHTPVLPDPLQGPAYLVSHGGAQFPDLVLDLSGDGVIVQVTGHTQIKNGITFSRFETVPDAPISSFELKLPSGPKSLLGNFGDICTEKVAKTLVMPTTITAQSGAVLKQTTKLGVTGCKRKRHAAKGKHPKKSKRARRTASSTTRTRRSPRH
jgi:hypothetical protein